MAGSALCGAARDMLQLILFRALQGIGAGMLMPITFTIVGDIFPGAARARMQGLFSSVWGTAALMFFAYKESRGVRRPIDWLGSFTVTAGVVLLLVALVQGGEAWARDSPTSIGLFAGAAAMLGAFVAVERRAVEPVLDLKLFSNRAFAVMSATAFLMGGGMFGAVIFVPWFIQGVEPVLAAIKGMMTDSLHVVFATGIGVVLAGALLVQRLGNTNLKAQAAAAEEAAFPGPVAVAEPGMVD